MNIHLKKIITDIKKYQQGAISQNMIISSILSLENQLTEYENVDLREQFKYFAGEIDEIEYSYLSEEKKEERYDLAISQFSKLLKKFDYKAIEVEKLVACIPISDLINYLISQGGEIAKQRINDPHFHELFFGIKINSKYKLSIPHIHGIINSDEFTYNCECHWSTIKIG